MNELFSLYDSHTGKVSDKWSSYLDLYHKLFFHLRNDPIRLLEIGIQNGGSLEIWSQYFKRAELILGVDVNPNCHSLTFESANIDLIVGDSSSQQVADLVHSKSSTFNLIIDDGSHTSTDIIKSFSHYFKYLSNGGIYIIEDLHCSYWSQYQGGLYHPNSSIAFFKRLIDVINHEHWGVDKKCSEPLKIFYDEYQIEIPTDILESIHSITFENSACIIIKNSPTKNQLGQRIIAGSSEPVVQGLLATKPRLYVPPQEQNCWSILDAPPEAQYETLNLEVHQLKNKTTSLKELNTAISQVNAKLEKSLEDKNEELLRISSLAAELSNNINSIQSSTSWKLTKPLRIIGTQTLRARNLISILPMARNHAGGFYAGASKGLRLFRKDGFDGIKRAAHFFLSKKQTDPASSSKSNATPNNNYEEWVRLYDTIDDEKRKSYTKEIESWDSHPKISIVMPTYNPNTTWLSEAIESVLGQLYTNWELCIADDKSPDDSVKEVLKKYSEQDKRIKTVFRTKNGHISAASNSALELATGEWTALLDHDDILPEDALYWVADAINRFGDIELIYSDEDKINDGGNRFGAYFKPDWNLDLFYSHNMFSHLGIYRTNLIRQVGGFRLGYEGSQDYDLALRCIEQISEKQIYHIPRILYHWRVHEESTAHSSDAKPYAMLAGERALNDHLKRTGAKGTVKYIGTGYAPSYPINGSPPLVSIIIPTKDKGDLLQSCIKSIFRRTNYSNFEIIIMDNGSTDKKTIRYLEKLNRDRRISVIKEDREFNYSLLNNIGVEKSSGSVICLLNNDIEVKSSDWLSVMVSHALRPEIGSVGAKLYYPNDTIQHAGVVLGLGGIAAHAHKGFPKYEYGYFGRAVLTQNYSAVTGACLVVEKSKYLEVGGLNEKQLAVAYNDIDFCLKLKEKGYRNVWTPSAELYHNESATRGNEELPEKKERLRKEAEYMIKQWGNLITNDPAYNPNLTLADEDFSLAWPPRNSNSTAQAQGSAKIQS